MMTVPSWTLVTLLVLAPLGAVAAQDHADHAAGHDGLPSLRSIATGSMHTAADVQFMQGMIAHHGQAIQMSRLAESRSADPRLIRFAQKIDQSQASEIRLMEGWLADRDQVVPDSTAYRTITMPGMLTAGELGELAGIKGTTFDKRFLQLMIRHHEGALAMVAGLLATPRAGQEVDVNVFANEVHAVQTAEIDLMLQMLANHSGDS
ncbi:MAG: DUF305 domain-containing protein [Gemmatimonadales bacterium]|nr:DUF305 domain-containing protein [Gemmatimonadales bacterium]